MARSSRRRGAKIPGVSTKMSCASPSIAMPRMIARVVCTLGLTIVTLLPTSALTRVDLPTFGAPMMATKPQRRPRRVGSAAATREAAQLCRLHALAGQHCGGGGLLGGALGAAQSLGRHAIPAVPRRRGTPDRDAARCGRSRGRTASAGRAPAPIPAASSWDRAAGAPACAGARPTIARPEPRPLHSRRRETPRRPRPRRHRPGWRCARGPPALDFGPAEPDRGAEIDAARHLGTGFLAHEIGESARQLALVGLGEGAEQHVGDDEAEHVIAEEFEALIAVPTGSCRLSAEMWVRALSSSDLSANS